VTTSAALCFFLAGLALLIVVPVYNWALPTRVHPFKGGYYSIHVLPWFIHNALFYLVRYTFLPFVTLTPFGLFFLRAMGMKIGRRAFINTEYISDPRLITLEDDAVLGGSVRIFAHYGGGDFADAFARIEAHYFVHGAWLKTDSQLLDDVTKIAHIPGVIVQGRYDVVCPAMSAWELHRAWPEAELQIVPDAGHHALEPGIVDALVMATDRFRGAP